MCHMDGMLCGGLLSAIWMGFLATRSCARPVHDLGRTKEIIFTQQEWSVYMSFNRGFRLYLTRVVSLHEF